MPPTPPPERLKQREEEARKAEEEEKRMKWGRGIVQSDSRKVQLEEEQREMAKVLRAPR